MATNKRQFTLRVPDEVFERVKAIAKHERRSIAVMIEMILLQYVYDYEESHIFRKDEKQNDPQ